MKKTLLAIILLVVIAGISASTLISDDTDSTTQHITDTIENSTNNTNVIEDNISDTITKSEKELKTDKQDNYNNINQLNHNSNVKINTKQSKQVTKINYNDSLLNIAQKQLNTYNINNSYLGVPEITTSEFDDSEILYFYPAYIIMNGKKLLLGNIMISNKQGLVADDIDPHVTDSSPYYTDNKEEFIKLAQSNLDEYGIESAYLGEPEINTTDYDNQNTYDFPVFTKESENETIGHIQIRNICGVPLTDVNINSYDTGSYEDNEDNTDSFLIENSNQNYDNNLEENTFSDDTNI